MIFMSSFDAKTLQVYICACVHLKILRVNPSVVGFRAKHRVIELMTIRLFSTFSGHTAFCNTVTGALSQTFQCNDL